MQSRTSRIDHARARAVVAALLALLAALGGFALTRDAEGAEPGKNIVLILTDDMTPSELVAMPNVQSLIAAQGVTFNHAYASFPICCPSRATILSGKYMHNHGVRGNLPPFGGWTRFVPHESNDVPVWLQDFGYYTAHIGKYLNGYEIGKEDRSLPVPPAWDEWYGKVSEEALYFNYRMIEKTGEGGVPSLTFYGDQPSDYQTDIFRDRAVDFIKDLDTGDQTPFLMNLWFNSPHAPFDPAPRDIFRRAGVSLPKLPGFNEKDISDKPKWFRKQARRRIGKRGAKTIANERRRQQEQLLSVDEAVAQLVQALSGKGILDDTYIVFTSDNGFFRGEHRIASGKYLPHEPSSRVPLVMRGPGIPSGAVSSEIVWLGDLAQTFHQIGSGLENPGIDGRSLLQFAEDPTRRSSRPVLLEGDTGAGGAEAESAHASAVRARVARVGLARRRGVKNLDQEPMAIRSQSVVKSAPAYRAIRTDRYLYVLYANGQTELYDMKRDSAQMRSLAQNRRYRYIRKWLYDRLVALSTCAGPSCRIEVGPEPAPLPKSVLRQKRGKKADD